jgi:hypothetical protein
MGDRVVSMSSESEQAQRTSINRKALEAAIAADVKTSNPSCEGFVGVVLERSSTVAGDANWAIKGIRFGRAERDKCNAAIISVVERMQRQYEVSDFVSVNSRTGRALV